jgi:hypothetical protein
MLQKNNFINTLDYSVCYLPCLLEDVQYYYYYYY